MSRAIVFIGGDRRNIELAKLLKEDGFRVIPYFLYDKEADEWVKPDSLEEALKEASAVIAGIPCTKDGDTLNADEKMSFTYLFNLMNESQTFFGGLINDKISLLANKRGIKLYDFLSAEEFSVLNAIPTAEGAIEIAIRRMNTTLHDSNVLILGFGRIGKILSKMLYGIGAKVYVTARNEIDFAWIRAYGYEKIEYKDLNCKLKNFDVIFNTIPTMILDEERLLLLKKDCLIIDLASKPGGVDFKKAEELNIEFDWALGLPGKIAPITAAKYMKELILKNI